ncbi:MAG: ABC transporter permease subunit [Polyangiaceae bacterium]
MHARFALLLALVALSLGTPALADPLSDLKARGVLRWGADQEGGGPYVYPRDDDPDRVTGFEVDLATALAAKLALKPEFTQAAWDKLPDMLETSKVDVVLNGYELTPERADAMTPSMPYYVYALALLTRTDDGSITRWEDLTSEPGGHRVRIGVLGGSAAETLANELCASGKGCDVRAYEGNTDTMTEVETGKLDATIEDTPIARFYASRFPKLHVVGEPRRNGYYVMYVPKGADALAREIDGALVDLALSGELQRIYERYGIWDERQKEILELARSARFFRVGHAPVATPRPAASAPTNDEPTGRAEPAPPSEPTAIPSARKRGVDVVAAYGKTLLEAAGLTVLLSVTSFPLAILVGLLIAIGRLYGPAWVRWPLAAYVEFLRGTPLMLQLYFLFFLLPVVGVALPALPTAILGLAINYSAYESEIYRAGLQAIPRGQMEAALALGMSRSMALRRIIVPQAVRIVIPPVVNDFIALFKDTSVCSVITLVELTKRFSILSQSTQATVELMAMTAVLYLAMSYPMSVLAQRIERRLGLEARA